jgi:transposase-like protein
MPSAVQARNRRSPIKPPDRCPFCNSGKIAPKGRRAKKLETVRLYRCRSCGRTFTPGPRTLRNKTYPIHEILEALTAYNPGLSLTQGLQSHDRRRGRVLCFRLNPGRLGRPA